MKFSEAQKGSGGIRNRFDEKRRKQKRYYKTRDPRQSLQRVAMSASIEDEYDVMIPVAKFGQFETVGALADFIMEEAE